MKLGANEPKKLVLLGVFGLIAVYLVYSNVFSGPSNRETPVAAPARAVDVPAVPGTNPAAESAQATAQRAPAGRGRSDEFHPVLRSKRPEDRIDPTKVDPTLRRDLLAKLQAVTASGTGRNLFQFGQVPVKELPKGPEPKVPLNPLPPVVTKVEPPKPTGPPPPPPINLKYYGYSSARAGGGKTAFFLDGEDILVAKEGDTLKRRYRLVRIGNTSVVMEDTESKRQQTIPLTEEAG